MAKQLGHLKKSSNIKEDTMSFTLMSLFFEKGKEPLGDILLQGENRRFLLHVVFISCYESSTVVAENRDIVAMLLRVRDDIPMVTTRGYSHSAEALRRCATLFSSLRSC